MMRKRGFTLLEVLIAMSLFTVLGFAVVLLMRTGLMEDLRQVLVPYQYDRIPFDPKNPDPEELPPALPPKNRFVSGYVVYRFGDIDVRCRYLAFVRDIAGLSEIELFDTRAGSNPAASAYIDGKDDEKEFEERNHLPTGGSAEVLWIWIPRSETELGVGTVFRAYRCPIGGKDTLLDPKNFDTLRELRNVIRPQPMLDGVTLFDLFFWTQFTTTWEWNRGEPRVVQRPQDPEQAKLGRPSCGPSRTWDSTRGMLVSNDDMGFRLNKGKESFNFSGDDIWPRVVRVQLARAEERTELSESFGPADMRFTLLSNNFATGHGELFGALMKVGAEWLTVTGRDGARTDIFVVEQRGLRDTRALTHPDGTPVYFGKVQDFDILCPSFRDDNN
jgi:prepilin-type N-terminal cleavage/methylation domain-containing protein